MSSPFHTDSPADGRLLGLLVGYVTDRADPQGLGRVRVCIPGLIEPESSWAWPLGTGGGGSIGRGIFAVPEVNAEVAVFFDRGDVERPHYLCGHWGRGEAPADNPANLVIATPTFRVEICELPEPSFKIINIRTGDHIHFNAADNTITLDATTAIMLRAVGAISLEGRQITIGGRVVRPIQAPI